MIRDGKWHPTKPENPNFTCRECGTDEIEYQVWESSDGAYEDIQYHCRGCNRRWWIEGPDA